jgi:hypothetical protein
MLTKELEGYLVELRKVYKDLLPSIDDLRKKHNLPPIEVKPNTVITP